MKKQILTLFLSIIGFGLFAQDKYLKSISKTQELSEKITELFYEKKYSEAYKELEPFWQLPADELKSLKEKTDHYLPVIEERIGKPIGTLKIKTEKISNIAIRETYFIRYEISAIRLVFTYYKNDNGWIVNAFKWDDTFADVFE